MSEKQQGAPPSAGYIRFFQVVPTRRSLSLFIDDKLYHKNWFYEDFTPYLHLPSGQHQVAIKDSKTEDLLFDKRINVKPYASFTYLFAEHPKKEDLLHLFALEDTKKAIHAPHCLLRLAHFAKPIERILLQAGNEKLFFKNIAYTQLSNYTVVEPNAYPFEVIPTTSEKPLLNLKPKPLKVGRLYTFYLIGNGSKAYPYKIVRSIDGPSFLPLQRPSTEAY